MINQIDQVIKFIPPKRSVPWTALLFFVLTAGLAIMLLFAILGYQILYLNRVYPGVSVAGVRVSGMTQQEITNVVTGLAAERLDQPVTIQAGSETWTFTGRQLGMWMDVEGVAHQAYLIGRNGNFLADMLTHLSLLVSSRNIELPLLYDIRVNQQPFQPLSDVIDYPAKDAELVIRSATDVAIIPARMGRRLDVEATRPLIEAAIFDSSKQPVLAVTHELAPTVTDDDLMAVYRQIKNTLSRPLTFNLTTDTETAEWQLEPEAVIELLNVIETVGPNGKPQYSVEFNKEGLAPFVEKLAGEIEREAVNAQLEFNPETGELIVVKPSRTGQMLDIKATYEQAALAVASGSNFVKLPLILTSPQVPGDNLESLGIQELVSEATSYFKGSSQARMHNIALAASKFDGVIVPPGQVFSFNEHLGQVTKELGYDESLIIYGDRTAVGIGGGVCQVSTTAFRAALMGGYEIVERWAHGYRVSWYEINSTVGLDATIYTPDVDFRFRNDTDHFLVIQTETDLEAGTLTFKFYGTPTNREVIISEPEITNQVKHGEPIYEDDPTLPEGFMKQVDWAQDGMDVKVTRLVKEGDQIIHRDEFRSHYQPWQAVYKVGTRR